MQRRGVLLSIDGKSETKSRERDAGSVPLPSGDRGNTITGYRHRWRGRPQMARQALRQAWSPVSLTSTLSSLLTSRGQSQSSQRTKRCPTQSHSGTQLSTNTDQAPAHFVLFSHLSTAVQYLQGWATWYSSRDLNPAGSLNR